MFKLLFVPLFLLQPWLFSGLVRLEYLPVCLCILYCVVSGRDFGFPIKQLILSIGAVALVGAVALAHLSFEPAYFTVAVKAFAIFWSGYFLQRFGVLSRQDLLMSLRITALLSLLFFVACTFSDAFQSLALSLKGQTYGIENKLEVYRLWFPTSAHTFHLGLFFFISVCAQLMLRESLGWITITFICACIAARSSMVASLCMLMLGLFMHSRGKFVLFCAVTLLLGFFALALAEESMAVRYVIEPLVNIAEGKGAESKSTDTLVEKHLYVPESQYLIVGAGHYILESGKFFGGTDSGIMRPVLYGGMFFQVFYIALIVFLLSGFRGGGILYLAMLLACLALNVKAEFIVPGPHLAILTLMYWIRRPQNKCKTTISNLTLYGNDLHK